MVDVPEVKKKCPNCAGDLEQTETGLFCQPCDLTFSTTKGRVIATPGGKGRLQELEETIMVLQNENDKIKKHLFGSDHLPFWMR